MFFDGSDLSLFFIQEIFSEDLIRSIFISPYFVSVEKSINSRWIEITENFCSKITNYIASGLPLFDKYLDNNIYQLFIHHDRLVFRLFNIINIKGYDIFTKNTEDSDLVNNLLFTEYVDKILFNENEVVCFIKKASSSNLIFSNLSNIVFDHFSQNKGFYNDLDFTIFNLNLDDTIGTTEREFTDFEKEIIHIIDNEVLPAVMTDGGDIKFVKFDNNAVYIQLEGSCIGCSSSTNILITQIEKLLKFYFKEIQEIIVI